MDDKLKRRLGYVRQKLFGSYPGYPILKPTDTCGVEVLGEKAFQDSRSEEHTSELQSPCNLVCRLLLEKKNTPLSSTKAGLEDLLDAFELPCSRVYGCPHAAFLAASPPARAPPPHASLGPLHAGLCAPA